MLTADEAWGEVQREFARIDAAPGPRRRRPRRGDEVRGDDVRADGARVPDLTFEFDEPPPRWTAQAGRRVRVVAGKPMMYMAARVKKAAAQLAVKFRERIPAGWKPKEGACRVEAVLIYPLRKGEKVPDGDVLIPHVQRGDLTNLWKIPEDIMARTLVDAGAVGFDDSQIFDLHLMKYRGRRPRWSVRLWWERGAGQTQFDF